MGCFDRVYITCPSCKTRIEFQSKAGKCYLEEYDESAVPIAIADDLEGDIEHCSNCNATIVATQIIHIKTVAMHGVLEEKYKELYKYE